MKMMVVHENGPVGFEGQLATTLKMLKRYGEERREVLE